MPYESQDIRVQILIDRLKGGDLAARDALLALTFDHLKRLARMMLRGYPDVHRWDETDDIMQGASLRLYKALAEVTPPTPKDFFRLAALQIRRELNRPGPAVRRAARSRYESREPRPGPRSRAGHPRGRRHARPGAAGRLVGVPPAAGSLPDELGAVFDLIYYQGLTQAEAAETLGVTVRTIKRYWREARLALHRGRGRTIAGRVTRAQVHRGANRMRSRPLDDRMSDLLARWEELREQGQTVSAESLCADCPELAPELTRQIQALLDMDRLLVPGGPDGAGKSGRGARSIGHVPGALRRPAVLRRGWPG